MKCLSCGKEIEKNVLFCPHCGGKNDVSKESNTNKKESKMSFLDKTWVSILFLFVFPPIGIILLWWKKKFNIIVRVILSLFFGLVFISIFATNNINNSSKQKQREVIAEEVTNSSDLESAIKRDFKSLDLKLNKITEETWDDGTEYKRIEIIIKNDYTKVNEAIEIIKKYKDLAGKEMFLVFTDKDGVIKPSLMTVSIFSDGMVKSVFEHEGYNNEHRTWINSQFSKWDGSHIELTKLIKKNLNDEDSYKHSETNYIDCNTQERVNTVNGVLLKSGYSNRVSEGDLFITTVFSANNAFGGRVKNTAYGIVSEKTNTVTLVAIE